MTIRKAIITKIRKRGLDECVALPYIACRMLKVPTTCLEHMLTETDIQFLNGLPLTTRKVDPNRVKAWITLWPKPSVTNLTYSVSGNTSACITKFNTWFRRLNDVFPQFEDYDDDELWQLITDATNGYLTDRANNGWFRCKKNSKFIYDENGSFLEEWINRVLDNEVEEELQAFRI